MQHGVRRHSLRARAGAFLPETEWWVGLMRAVERLCSASGPLAVEVFCGGALGAALRVAQRLVAAQVRVAEGDLPQLGLT